MFNDPWPDEPDEYNPEERWGDPESDLPKVPKAPDASESAETIGSEAFSAFWVSVILANVALFALSLGPMLVFFRGQWLLGGGLFLLGLAALVRTYQHVRAFQNRDRDGAGDSENDGE